MNFRKSVGQVRLTAYPPLLQEIFDLLRNAGATHYALFGGAARGADYAARKGRAPAINDYDLRIWIGTADDEYAERDFIDRLSRLSGADIRETPSAGTGRIRYCLNFLGADLDISVRPVPETGFDDMVRAEAVAVDRAGDADIGLCSIAVDPRGHAWATPEYQQDQDNDTLTVYPNGDNARRESYAARMQAKFPFSRLLWLGGRNPARAPAKTRSPSPS